jgi:hypothetical protein
MVRIIVALVALLAASSAQADWQYTRWGMTVEELLASGKGISTIDQQESGAATFVIDLARRAWERFNHVFSDGLPPISSDGICSSPLPAASKQTR